MKRKCVKYIIYIPGLLQPNLKEGVHVLFPHIQVDQSLQPHVHFVQLRVHLAQSLSNKAKKYYHFKIKIKTWIKIGLPKTFKNIYFSNGSVFYYYYFQRIQLENLNKEIVI